MKPCKAFSDLELSILEYSINYMKTELLDILEKNILSLLSDFFTVD